MFDAAIRQAEKALDLTSVPELAMALPAAYEALKAAMEAYTRDLCAGWTPGEEVDLTWLLVNPDFSEGSKGWEGTPFTAASSGVAEFYARFTTLIRCWNVCRPVHIVFAPKAFIAMATRRKL